MDLINKYNKNIFSYSSQTRFRSIRYFSLLLSFNTFYCLFDFFVPHKCRCKKWIFDCIKIALRII